MATLTKEDAIALLSILEEVEGSEGDIDGIESAELDSEQNIVGVYFKQEGTKKYRYAYKVRPEEGTGAFTPISADAISSFLEPDPTPKFDRSAFELALDLKEPESSADTYTDRAVAESKSAIASKTQAVQELVQAIASRNFSDDAKYNAMQSGLVSLYREMPATEFGEVLAQAIAAAELAGRWEVTQEVEADFEQVDDAGWEAIANAEFMESLVSIFAGTGDFATKTASKKRNCTPGKSFECGNSCQKIGRNCKTDLPPAAKEAADWVGDKVGKTKKAKDKVQVKNGDRPISSKATLSKAEYSESDKNLKEWKSFTNRTLDPGMDQGEFDKLSDNSMVRDWIDIEKTPETFRGLKDAQGNLQAAASVTKKGNNYEIDHLATAPWNVTASAKDQRAMKGAGTAMMAEIVREALAGSSKAKIQLTALKGAKAFYEKIGFKTKGFSMELSPAAAKKFLTAYDARG